MKLRYLLLLLAALALAAACKTTKTASTPADNSPSLLVFGNKKMVSKAEFERVYQKNNGGYEKAKAHTPAQFREYLTLYTNFKRKVFEAEAMKLDQQPSFIQEFEQYRKQLAQPYLSAKEVEDRLIQEAYDRSKMSVNADHLLVSVSETAQPADTLEAYNKIMRYRDSITSGARSFSYMAERYSSDPSAKQNMGNLGFFTAFEMVYPFESAAFNTPVGFVSMPVRSQFGYHIIKANNKVPYEGKKRAAHVIVRVGDRYSAKDSIQARKKIAEIYDQLKQGGNFEELAKQFSDDPGTSTKGGDLGSGRLIQEMENMKLALGEGQVSEPFQTSFGWHIMKITEVERLKSFDESKSALKQKIARDSRAQISRDVLIQRVKKAADYKQNETVLTAFAGKVGEAFPRGAWTPDSNAKYAEVLFSIGDTTRTTKHFVEYIMSKRPRYPTLPPEEAARAAFKAFADEEIIKFEEARLPETNPEYRFLLQEYHDGILLFTLMEKMVWKKAVEDTAGLRKFYQDNRDSFKADETMEVKEYRTTKREVADQVLALLREGGSDIVIDSIINKTSSIALTRRTQYYERGKADTDTTLFTRNVGFISDILEEKGSFRVMVVEKKLPAGIKPFDMAKSECITKYQDYLEKQWLQQLATKYPVKINEETFGKLYQ